MYLQAWVFIRLAAGKIVTVIEQSFWDQLVAKIIIGINEFDKCIYSSL